MRVPDFSCFEPFPNCSRIFPTILKYSSVWDHPSLHFLQQGTVIKSLVRGLLNMLRGGT